MILVFLPHSISLFMVICFEIRLTHTFLIFLEGSSYWESTVHAVMNLATLNHILVVVFCEIVWLDNLQY